MNSGNFILPTELTEPFQNIENSPAFIQQPKWTQEQNLRNKMEEDAIYKKQLYDNPYLKDLEAGDILLQKLSMMRNPELRKQGAYDAVTQSFQDFGMPASTNTPILDMVNRANGPIIPLTLDNQPKPSEPMVDNKPIQEVGKKPVQQKNVTQPTQTPVKETQPNPYQDLLNRLTDPTRGQGIKDAYDANRKAQIMSLISSGLSNMGAALGGGNSTVLDAKNPFAEALKLHGTEGITEAKDLQQIADENLKRDISSIDLKNSLEAQDPKSPISTMMRNFLNKTLGAGTVKDDVSYAQLSKIAPNMISAYQSRLNAEMQRNQLAQKQMDINERQRERLDDSRRKEWESRIDKYRSAIFKDIGKDLEKMTTYDTLASTLKMAQDGNEPAVSSVKALFAGTYEGGRLTDEDVERYSRGQGWARRMQDYLSKASQGKFSEMTADDLQDLISMLKDRAEYQVGRKYNQHMTSYIKQHKDSPDLERMIETLDPNGYSRKFFTQENKLRPYTLPSGQEVLVETIINKDGKVQMNPKSKFYNPITLLPLERK